MNSIAMIVSLSDGIVLTDGHEHPEPRPVPGADASSWGSSTIPGCKHDPCPAKLRAWAGYGRRSICDDPGCGHLDCPPRLRATEDHQPFGVRTTAPRCRSTSWTPTASPSVRRWSRSGTQRGTGDWCPQAGVRMTDTPRRGRGGRTWSRDLMP